jgi:flavin-dependent dehydrogenase
VVPRAHLDQALRDAIASRVHLTYERTVEEVMFASSGRVGIRLRDGRLPYYDGVVLAVGGGQTLPRALRVDGAPIAGASLRAYVGQSEGRAPRFFLGDQWRAGYAWSFPVAAGITNVGVCALGPDRVKGLARAARDFGSRWSRTAPVWKGGAGPLWSGRATRWHDDRGVVSCGDAAGVANPSSGEGVTAALETGTAAGIAIACFVRERDATPLRDYSSWVRQHFNARYAAGSQRDAWAILAGV